MKIINGSINIDANGANWYHVIYENGTEESFFPYIEPAPDYVLEFFNHAMKRHKKLMKQIYKTDNYTIST